MRSLSWDVHHLGPNRQEEQEPGKCPVCNQWTLQYEVEGFFDDEYYGHKWICQNCYARGIEWKKLEFNGHEVEGRD